MGDQAPGPTGFDHLRGQIDANDLQSLGLEEGCVGAGRRTELEEGGYSFLSKDFQEDVALGGLPSWSGPHGALLDPAIIGVTEDSRHVVSHLRRRQQTTVPPNDLRLSGRRAPAAGDNDTVIRRPAPTAG
jgi:hypothetical protein